MMRFSTTAMGLAVVASDTSNMFAEGVSCGSPLTTECLGDTDVRYDNSHTNDLKEQDPRWGTFEGYWKVALIRLPVDGNPVLPEQRDPNGNSTGIPYDQKGRVAYYNHTFLGSRFIANRYYFLEPAPQAFCDQPLKPGFFNTIRGGTCGVNGLLNWASFYAVSSFENNGGMNEIRSAGAYSPIGENVPLDHPELPSRYTVLDSGTIANFLQIPGVMIQDSSYVFIDNNTAMVTHSIINLVTKSRTPLTAAQMTRITEEEFVQGIESSNQAFNILPSERLPIPFNDTFNPTEEEWCDKFKDPSCSVSPYQEPAANLNTQGIVLTVVLCLAFAISVFIVVFKHSQAAQKKRYKEQFIRTIARNITIAPAAGMLSHDQLQAEFDHIDKDKGGTISKDEMWDFISTEKVGTMSDKDFEAMWSTLDIDNSGSVDFVEFVAFLSSCGEQFDTVNEEQVKMTKEEQLKHASKRLSCRQLIVE